MHSKDKTMSRHRNTTKGNNQDIVTEDIAPAKKLRNEFEESYCIIMDAKPFLKRVVYGIPQRTNEHVIFLIREGKASITINFKKYELKKGNLVVIPANYIVYIEKYSEDLDPWMTYFNFNTAEEKELVGIQATHLTLSDKEYRNAEEYFNLMYESITQNNKSKEEFMHLVMSMLFRIQSLDGRRLANPKSTKIPKVQQIKSQFIHMVVTMDEPQLTIAEYAERLGISENYLSIIIKQETKQTVKKWIEQKTETIIKMLLVDEENHTLNEISDIVGYSSPPQVVRFFKRRTGMTPYEYRKQKLMEKKKAIE